MTCQIGSEEPQWNQQHRAETQDGEQASKQASKPWHPPRVAVDATLEITLFFWLLKETGVITFVAVMYTRVVFFAVILALVGASAAENTGKFATSLRS